MKKTEARKIANEQYECHRIQQSGVWSVTEDMAKIVAEALGVDYDSAIDYENDMIYEEYRSALADEYQSIKRIIGEAAFVSFESSEAAELFEENFQSDFYHPSETKSEYFWSYLLDNEK